MASFSLMTFNIHSAIGRDGKADAGRIAEVASMADIVALQEVDRFWDRSGNICHAETIASLVGAHDYAWQANIDVHKDGKQRRQFGNLLLSRFPILSVRRHALPKSVQADRLGLQCGVMEAIIDAPVGPLRLYNTHVLTSDRRIQIPRLRRIIEEAPDEGAVISGSHEDPTWFDEPLHAEVPETVIVTGDLNLRPSDPLYDSLTSGGAFLLDAWTLAHGDGSEGEGDPGATYFTDWSAAVGERLDYCLVNAPLAPYVSSAQVLSEIDASDHQPLLVRFAAPDRPA